jgi:hypothetical protein
LHDKHLKVVKKAENNSDVAAFERYKEYTLHAYLHLLVGTTIFSNKVKNYVNLTYFKDLDLGYNYAWGHCCTDIPISGVVKLHRPLCKYVAGYLTVL